MTSERSDRIEWLYWPFNSGSNKTKADVVMLLRLYVLERKLDKIIEGKDRAHIRDDEFILTGPTYPQH